MEFRQVNVGFRQVNAGFIQVKSGQIMLMCNSDRSNQVYERYIRVHARKKPKMGSGYKPKTVRNMVGSGQMSKLMCRHLAETVVLAG